MRTIVNSTFLRGFDREFLEEMKGIADGATAAGARFDDRATGKPSEFCRRATIVHIDADHREIGKLVRADHSVVGDAREIVSELLPLVGEASRPEWRARVSELRARYPLASCAPCAARLLASLAGRAPRDAIVTTDVGQHQMWVAQHFGFEEPNRLMTSGGLGTMGYGLPAAIGAQLAHPKALVVDVAGEASILMNMQEMSTAAQYRLPVKIFILNNQYMGMVRQWQELLHGGRYSESYTDSLPDFVKLADAYGAHGIRCADPADLDAALEEMIETPKAVIFDCLVDQKENCFPMIPSGKAHNEMLMAELEDDAGIEIGNVIDEKGKMLV